MSTDNKTTPEAPIQQVGEVNNAPALQQKPLTPSERFINVVMSNFATNAGEITISSFQKKLIQNYFIKIDMVLKAAEIKRMTKKPEYREALAYTWENVNLQKLAIDVISYSAVGLDPTQPNHLNPIPFKNNATNLYDITFIQGYKGIEIKAKKYGLKIPDDVVVELVYANDKFIPYKKDATNKSDNYVFEIVTPFERGEIIGGFYYHQYFNEDKSNKLEIFTKKDIDKRKPVNASAEFWGGVKDNWVDGKRQGTIETEGWYEEMAYKTIYRAAYNSITIDSEKIDQHYLEVMERERENFNVKLINEMSENANRPTDIGFEENSDQQTKALDAPIQVQDTKLNQPSANPIEAKQPEQATTNQEKKDRGF